MVQVRRRMTHALLKILPLWLAAAALTGCSIRVPLQTEAASNTAHTTAPACAASLGGSSPGDHTQGLGGTIRLFSWNVQKNTAGDMRSDILRLASGADLILLQEANASTADMASYDTGLHWQFAPGYRDNGEATGVMTASNVAPRSHCRLSRTEPWLRSPKAINITQYDIAGSARTLLVVNVHMINFTFGIDAMLEQLQDATQIVATHDGPVIFSGDFNTWNERRSNVVDTELRALGLSPVNYSDDRRKRVFGLALDHVYVRDLRVAASSTYAVASSDHNPLSVLLRFEEI